MLGLISKHFAKTEADAKRLQDTLQKIHLLTSGGVALGGIGLAGFKAIGAMVKPAEEYAHQLSLMNAAGMKQKEIAEAISASWKTGADIQSTNVTENLKAVRELRMVFGSTEEATRFLPQMQRISSVLENVLGENGKGKGGDVAFAAAKALELRGASRTPEAFAAEADLMTKAVIASGGKVQPKDILQAVKYGGVAATGFSRDFMYGMLPTLVQELGGQSTGTALTSMSQAIIGGVMSQRSLKTWADLGLVDMSKAIFTKTGSLKGIEAGGIKGSQEFQTNPFQYVQDILLPALIAHGHTDQADQQAIITRMFGNRTAARIANILATQGPRMQKDFNLIGEAGTSAAYDEMLAKDPREAQKALGMQWENLKTAMGITVIPLLLPVLRSLTDAITGIGQAAQRHPTIAKWLTEAAIGFSALATVGGGIMFAAAGLMVLGPALKGFGFAFKIAQVAIVASIRALGGALVGSGPVGWIILGIAAAVAAAYEIYTHWGQIKPKLMEVWDGIVGWFTGMVDKLKSILPDFSRTDAGHNAKGLPIRPAQPQQSAQVHTTVKIGEKAIVDAVTAGIVKGWGVSSGMPSTPNYNLQPLQPSGN